MPKKKCERGRGLGGLEIPKKAWRTIQTLSKAISFKKQTKKNKKNKSWALLRNNFFNLFDWTISRKYSSKIMFRRKKNNQRFSIPKTTLQYCQSKGPTKVAWWQALVFMEVKQISVLVLNRIFISNSLNPARTSKLEATHGFVRRWTLEIKLAFFTNIPWLHKKGNGSWRQVNSEKIIVEHLYLSEYRTYCYLIDGMANEFFLTIENSTLREHQLILDWLNETSSEKHQIPEAHCAARSAMAWENTLHQIQERFFRNNITRIVLNSCPF